MNYKNNTIGLLGASLMNNVLYMFLNTFMVAYFITLTNYNYKLISVYYIVSFIFILITFLLLGIIVKNKKQIHIFRIGIVLHLLYVLLLAFLKEDIISYYILLGAFYGIAQGFFWGSGHTLINKYVGGKSDEFISVQSMIGRIFKIFFPIIFGASIELTSFSYIARVVIIIGLIELAFSFFVKEEKCIYKDKYNIKMFYKKFKSNKALKNYYKISSCDGVFNYLLETLVTILIVMTFKTTISLGFLTTLFAIFSIFSVFIYQNKVKNKSKMLKISTIGMILSILMLIFNISKITIVIYNLCAGFFLIILKNAAQSKRYTITNNIKEVEENYLVEHQFFSEFYLNISRIIGYAVLFVASLFNNMIVFKILLALVGVVILVFYRLMKSVDSE